MKLIKNNQPERLLPCSSGQTDKPNETISSPQGASRRKRLPLSVLLVAGLGAMTYLTGCDVTVREPGIVVTPPVVQVETPTVAVEAPAVVLEEGVAVVPPAGVEFVLMDGRYAWFGPEGRWYYRPMGWRPPAGYHAREVHSMRELETIHRSEMRRGPGGRPEVGREPGRKPDVRREAPRKAPQKQEKKKEEKKRE
jgi:hypothetical protein